MRHQYILAFMLGVLLGSGCVTQTERVPYRPYVSREDEGVLAELRRELGWHPSSSVSSEPLYRRAVRGAREAVSDWFREEESLPGARGVEESRRRFEQEQQEAFRRLRERQAREQEE
jgi:hypothetical protein